MPKRRLDVRNIKKKIEAEGIHKLYKYEQDYYWKRLRDRADYLAQLYPKLVAYVVNWELDENKKVQCLTCPRKIKFSQANWCHWIEKGSSWQYWCRRKERNIYNCCEQCNAWTKERHHSMLTLHVTKLYWIEWVEQKLQESRQTHSRPKIRDIEEVIEHYEKLINNLAQNYL